MLITNQLLPVKRLDAHKEIYPEIKDPSMTFANGKWYMYASVGRSSDQQWIVGRFVADQPEGLWTEIDPVEFIGIQGPQLCAPAVLSEQTEDGTKWNMYIQTACFEENGVIAEASSDDGKTFSSIHASLITNNSVVPENPHKVVGVYDAGISEVTLNGEDYYAMIFSGYRQVGSGDIYVTWKKKNDPKAEWTPAKLILDQDDVPFHNKPTYTDFEWGLEGGKILQVAADQFLLIGVCFLPLPNTHRGARQRVFIAASHALDGPYIPLGTPFPPQKTESGAGEHGHPDTIIHDGNLFIVFQERMGDNKPWHLRYAVLDLTQYKQYAYNALSWAPMKN